MNLSEALDAALPEIPKTRLARTRPPRLDPDLIVRDDVLDGEPIVGVLQREKANFFRFPPEQWRLAQLFDGIRSYEEIAALYSETAGQETTAEEVRLFAENMDEAEFWHKTPQEKNLALSAKLVAQRSRRASRKSKINIAHISFSAWDPDRYLTWLDRAVGRFVYSRWCVLAVILLFLFEALIYVTRWSVLGPDIALYFNFTRKSLLDLAQFWTLFLILGFFHETAHGLTCKHYGGEVHSMGLMFLYLTPAFYVDVTETWISATRLQRLATILAGVWLELVICGFAMILWLNTITGEWLHDFTYQIILLTGIAVVAVNFNPLIKLDGYYFLTEFIGIPDLKERSTAFLSGWCQNRILRLPVEVPVVPRRRVTLFVIYAILSGSYSYLLLFFVIRFSYNVASHWLAEFALIPAGALAFGVFRGRLRSLRDVLGRLGEQYFGSGFRWRAIHYVALAASLVIVFVPISRDRESALFVIEPAHSAVVHASLPGRIESVLVNEGDRVRAGQPLFRMTSGDASAMGSAAAARARTVQFQSFEAQLRGQSIGAAGAAQEAAARSEALAFEAQTSLLIVAPSAGVVMTEDPSALREQNIAAGQALLSLADTGPPSVRVFVPASALDRIPADAELALAPPGRFAVIRMRLAPLRGDAVALPGGLVAKQDYKGIVLPAFYSATMTLPASAQDLPIGMSGTARIFGARRSFFERSMTVVGNVVRAHVW
jgi:putative peptide zinc metalloprotease protein